MANNDQKKIAVMSMLQQQALNKQSNDIKNREADINAAKVADQTHADLVTGAQKQEGEKVNKLALPGMDKGSSFGDMILPLMGLIAGAAVGGPAGAMMGMGGGTYKTMEMKNRNTSDELNRSIQRDQLTAQEAHQRIMEQMDAEKERRLNEQFNAEQAGNSQMMEMIKSLMAPDQPVQPTRPTQVLSTVPTETLGKKHMVLDPITNKYYFQQ